MQEPSRQPLLTPRVLSRLPDSLASQIDCRDVVPFFDFCRTTFKALCVRQDGIGDARGAAPDSVDSEVLSAGIRPAKTLVWWNAPDGIRAHCYVSPLILLRQSPLILLIFDLSSPLTLLKFDPFETGGR